MITSPARVGGAVLAAAVRVLSSRPADKPMHPAGRVRAGRLTRHGLAPGIGVPFIDHAGVDDVVVRESRGIGLPPALPDIHGLAIQVTLGPGAGDGAAGDGAAGDGAGEADGRRRADLLFSTNGWGPVSRFLVVPSVDVTTRPMTTLFPYRSPSGPVLLGVRYLDQDRLELAVAAPRSPWRVFADLHLEPVGPGQPDDPEVEFDAVLHEVPGLANYDWVRRLREPSYRTARKSRR